MASGKTLLSVYLVLSVQPRVLLRLLGKGITVTSRGLSWATFRQPVVQLDEAHFPSRSCARASIHVNELNTLDSYINLIKCSISLLLRVPNRIPTFLFGNLATPPGCAILIFPLLHCVLSAF